MKSAERIDTPHVVYLVENSGFSSWFRLGLWALSGFDSLPRGGSALWHHTVGSGAYPNHSGYDSTGVASSDFASSPPIDLSPFVNPDGSGENNNVFWTVCFRLRFRPDQIKPTLSGSEQAFSRLKLSIEPVPSADLIEIGEFDDADTTTPYGGKVEFSRINPSLFGSRSTGILTFTANPTDGETVEIGTETYTFRTNILSHYDVEIGVNLATSILNLAGAINLGAGVYNGSVASDFVSATYDATTLTATALNVGAAGDVGSTETLANGSWGAATLLGGVDASTDPDAPEGAWWFEQLIVPDLETQALLLGQPEIYAHLTLDAKDRDAASYGLGICSFSVEILRADAETNAFLRGGFGGLPPIEPTFPSELYRSWSNTRRWS